MSLFGKILALFNVIGAAALVAFLITDYGKRQAFSYSVLRYDLALSGLPLDENEKGSQGEPRVDQLSEKTLTELFSQAGGNPQPTQVAEVNRVRTLWMGKVDALNIRGQIHLMARILLPLTDTYLEREEMLACRHYFATDAALAGFKARYQKALAEALARTDRGFEETFHASMRTLGGEPSEAFTITVLNQLPAVRDKAKVENFDNVWNKALAEQAKSMRSRLEAKFAQAILGSDLPSGQQGQSQDAQKRAIARLLFSLCVLDAEEANDPKLQKLAPNSLAYGTALLDTDAYKRALKRVYTVSGIRTAMVAISEEAEIARTLTEKAGIAQEKDLTSFMLDNAALIADLRGRAELVHTEMDRIKENEFKLAEQKMLVEKRMRDVKELQDELDESRKSTDEVVTQLRDLSSKLLDERVKVRNAIKEIEDMEKIIIQKEALIRAREKKSRRGE